ncbi:MAG: threonine aldolase family protein, partial [Flavisolibacter sp.]
DVHKAHSSLVSLENTSNRGGGSCYDLEEIRRIKKVCEENRLRLHLDGARLFNALVEKKENPKDYGQLFESISVCLSKSLGCPVGSLLLGKKDFIRKARRVRKVFGGGMRQGGYLAAAGIYALQNNIDRLGQDHDHAKQISEALAKKSFVGDMLPVETNIVIFAVKQPWTSASFVDKLKESGILGHPISPTQVRLVTHLDVTALMVEKTIDVINKL